MHFHIILKVLGNRLIADGCSENVSTYGSCAIAVAGMVYSCDECFFEVVEMSQSTIESDDQRLDVSIYGITLWSVVEGFLNGLLSLLAHIANSGRVLVVYDFHHLNTLADIAY